MKFHSFLKIYFLRIVTFSQNSEFFLKYPSYFFLVHLKPFASVNIVSLSCIMFSYLEQDLDGSVDGAHPPAEQGEEREHELHEVVGNRLEAMKPPRRKVHVVRHGIRDRLGLKGKTEDIKLLSPIISFTYILLY